MSAPVDMTALLRVPELLDRVERAEARIKQLECQLAAVKEPATDDLISVDEAAEICGRQRDALYKLVQRRRLPAQRRGRALLVRRADVEALKTAVRR